MRSMALALAACLAAAAAAAESGNTCKFKGLRCVWRGYNAVGFCSTKIEPPAAGDPYPERVATTEFLAQEAICGEWGDAADGVDPGDDCCAAYGTPCVHGHKELWCEKPARYPAHRLFHNRKAEGMCEHDGRACKWHAKGSSMCGGSEFAVGDWNRFGKWEQQLVATTEDLSRSQICAIIPGSKPGGEVKPGSDCCREEIYGQGCTGGYKRLWCY